MSNTNAILPFFGSNLQELVDTIGITQFPTGTSWFQTIGGLLIQGNFIDSVGSSITAIPFYPAYPTQVLGVWTQVVGGVGNNAHVDTITLEGFTLHSGGAPRSYYWWAIGV